MTYDLHNLVICWPYFVVIAAVTGLFYLLKNPVVAIYYFIVSVIVCAIFAYVGDETRVHLSFRPGTSAEHQRAAYMKYHEWNLYGVMVTPFILSGIGGGSLGYFVWKNGVNREDK